MVALNCVPTLLGQYQVLTRQDLKSSTAILDPNQPGSTSLKLSWIWHSGKWLLMQEDHSLHQTDAVPTTGPVIPRPDLSDPDNTGPVIPAPALSGPVNAGAVPGPTAVTVLAGQDPGSTAFPETVPAHDTLTLQECMFPPPF